MGKKNTTRPAAPKQPVETPKAVEQDGTKQVSDTAAAPTTIQTAQVPTEPAAPPVQPPKAKSKVPASVKLMSPHGFIDENEQHRYWHSGQEVTDPEEIALLIERKAPLEGIEYGD